MTACGLNPAVSGPHDGFAKPTATSTESALLIPYDDIMFTELRGSNMLFFDFTSYIPALVQYRSKNMLITRPSRFCKSLFLDTLATYVDEATSEESFRAAFGGTAVFPDGSKELPADARSYCVLRLSLGLNVSDPDPVVLDEQLGRVVLRACRKLVRRYQLSIVSGGLSQGSARRAGGRG